MTPEEVLSSGWSTLNKVLLQIDEESCRILLEQELSGRKRGPFCFRIYSRYNRLRANRERRDIMDAIGDNAGRIGEMFREREAFAETDDC